MHAPSILRPRRLAVLTLIAVAATLAVTGCSRSGSTPVTVFTPASGAVSSALANPTVSTDLNAAEQQLLANLQANFRPAHPVASVQAAVKATYPQGDTARISQYAVKTFTLPVLHTKGPGSVRDLWLQGVVAYAEQQGAHPASSSPSPGSVPAPAATASATPITTSP